MSSFSEGINYYETLQVSPTADPVIIKKAYHAIMSDLGAHPDKGGDEELAKTINEAYSVLSVPEKRQQYDAFLTSLKEEEPRQARPRPAQSPEGKRSQPAYSYKFHGMSKRDRWNLLNESLYYQCSWDANSDLFKSLSSELRKYLSQMEKLDSQTKLADIVVNSVTEKSWYKLSFKTQFLERGYRKITRPYHHGERIPKASDLIQCRLDEIWDYQRTTGIDFKEETLSFELESTQQRFTCPACHGKQEVPCPSCDHRGKVSCSTCRGSGVCPGCDGKGRKICMSCMGKGRKKTADGRLNNCLSCNGKGSHLCKKCNGSSHCATCAGKGLVICKQCKGHGEIPCRTCQATGSVVQAVELIEQFTLLKRSFQFGHDEFGQLLHRLSGSKYFLEKVFDGKINEILIDSSLADLLLRQDLIEFLKKYLEDTLAQVNKKVKRVDRQRVELFKISAYQVCYTHQGEAFAAWFVRKPSDGDGQPGYQMLDPHSPLKKIVFHRAEEAKQAFNQKDVPRAMAIIETLAPISIEGFKADDLKKSVFTQLKEGFMKGAHISLLLILTLFLLKGILLDHLKVDMFFIVLLLFMGAGGQLIATLGAHLFKSYWTRDKMTAGFLFTFISCGGLFLNPLFISKTYEPLKRHFSPNRAVYTLDINHANQWKECSNFITRNGRREA